MVEPPKRGGFLNVLLGNEIFQDRAEEIYGRFALCQDLETPSEVVECSSRRATVPGRGDVPYGGAPAPVAIQISLVFCLAAVRVRRHNLMSCRGD